jgi:Mrp family chromosome partitioning ATPase
MDDSQSAPPLHQAAIRYTRTRVDTGAGQHLHQQPGVMRNDRSPLAETLRLLRSQVLQSLRAEGHRLIAVTSPRALPNQALTATNLALALAAALDSTVLLVDADLHGRGVQALFGLERAAGLAEHLSEGAALPDLLVHPGLPRLVLLPAGASAPSGSSELLASRVAQHCFTEFKTRYADRYVVVHLPPVLDSADTLAFLPQADTTLLLVQQQGTSLADLELASERLAPFPLLGAVMLPAR